MGERNSEERKAFKTKTQTPRDTLIYTLLLKISSGRSIKKTHCNMIMKKKKERENRFLKTIGDFTHQLCTQNQ